MSPLRWLKDFMAGVVSNPALNDPPVLPVVEVPAEKCPFPLSSDDGTRVDCKTKRHCGCEDAL